MLHIICGNCGSNKDFTHSIEKEDEDGKDLVYISCKNCSTLHDLSDNSTLKE